MADEQKNKPSEAGEAAEKKSRRRGRKAEQAEATPTAEETAVEETDAEETAAEEADGEETSGGEGTQEDAGDEQATEERKPARRRSAETAAAAERRPAPTRDDGSVVVSARARYVRSAPRKARLVMDHIRGKEVERARAILGHTPRAVSSEILKLLNSAVANAEANYELAADELRVDRAFVDEGPIIKRYRPRALGRATRINKRTSHMTIELTTAASPARRGR